MRGNIGSNSGREMDLLSAGPTRLQRPLLDKLKWTEYISPLDTTWMLVGKAFTLTGVGCGFVYTTLPFPRADSSEHSLMGDHTRWRHSTDALVIRRDNNLKERTKFNCIYTTQASIHSSTPCNKHNIHSSTPCNKQKHSLESYYKNFIYYWCMFDC